MVTPSTTRTHCGCPAAPPPCPLHSPPLRAGRATPLGVCVWRSLPRVPCVLARLRTPPRRRAEPSARQSAASLRWWSTSNRFCLRAQSVALLHSCSARGLHMCRSACRWSPAGATRKRPVIASRVRKSRCHAASASASRTGSGGKRGRRLVGSRPRRPP